MALAHLCSQIRRTDPAFCVSDNRVSSVIALTVNHKLREGSTAEAWAVRDALREMGLSSFVFPLRWRDAVSRDVDPSTLPNLESLARKLRYRVLGFQSKCRHVVSLLLAQHEDDQYETVLMRLLAGHGPRGLRGMRPAHDIPECYDMHGVYQSGFVDDQRLTYPFYNMRPSKRDSKSIRLGLLEDMDPAVFARELGIGLEDDVDPFHLDDGMHLSRRTRSAPPLPPLDTEDSGVMIYRPLLEFSKDRLIATCEHNKVPWFEDHTNSDPTLTTRNALRHMSKHHQLPAALQKPAILRLAARCRRSIGAEEAEAERLIRRSLVQNFGPNAGTLLLRLPAPKLRIRRERSLYSATWRERRLRHMTTVAALAIRKLLRIVSPEQHLTPVTNLQAFVPTLFPFLSEDAERAPPGPPKAFCVCGVHFVPVQTRQGPLSWFLSRAPHPSTAPPPGAYFPGLPERVTHRSRPERWRWPDWSPWRLFDGRFWVRVRSRLPSGVLAMPFLLPHAKPFREALPDDAARAALAALLKKHAPGKVRYTLPALYAVEGIDWALRRQPYWLREEVRGAAAEAEAGEEVQDVVPGTDDAVPEADADVPDPDDLEAEDDPYAKHEAAELRRWLVEGKWGGERTARMRLLALPTLGIYAPGIEHWLQWEMRYRKVDRGFLERDDGADGGPWGPRRVRRRRRWIVLGRWARWRWRRYGGTAGARCEGE